MAKFTLTLMLIMLTVCPEQQFLSTDGLDMSQVAVDPVSGQPLVFHRVSGFVNQPIILQGRACDPDIGDPNAAPQQIRVWREPGNVTVPVDTEGYFNVQVNYTTPGKKYETFGVTDGFDVRLGTIVVDVYKTNRPPVLCGGSSETARSR